MATIWPFYPVSDMIEVMAWLTDVIRTQSEEQRLGLRRYPRRSFVMQHVLSQSNYAAARTIARGADTYLVPDWTQVVPVASVSAGSSVSIPFSTATYDFGDLAILWESVDKFEQVTVDAFTGSGVTIASVSQSYTNAKLMPLWESNAPQGLSAQRPAGNWINAEITFDLIEPRRVSAGSWPEYRSADVLVDCPVVGSGAFDEAVVWPVDTIDSSLGIWKILRTRAYPDESWVTRWHVFNRTDAYSLRRWLNDRRGRQVSFWMSSWARDLEMATTLSSGSTSLTVFAKPAINDLARESFDVEIVNGANKYYRRVTNVAAGSPVGGRNTLTLTLDSATGATVATGARISFMRHCRFNADRIELAHSAGAGITVAVPCIEVPYAAGVGPIDPLVYVTVNSVDVTVNGEPVTLTI